MFDTDSMKKRNIYKKKMSIMGFGSLVYSHALVCYVCVLVKSTI